ncbi:EF-P 5-aminopentanol modification-associated protein YfmH [Trichococcus shcherbakoviae]|uniref:Insulinase family protein n=1 Tax=Trichococcus shcherbakoviae subsp. psychrophilus TaxID=2585775 RepID=A0A5C5E8U5_9LACT|nr:pitrilysin family protein [Trichococcus shcherbakoviae]TNV69188.1 insulinase family protein [Trichococcus shcherbakoviae subsp. psychrophilus]
MNKVHYEALNETVYTEVLDNGLQVVLIPKNKYSKTYGIFTTDFGSIDNQFVPINGDKEIKIPDGIAHFLEHKLFEGEDHDAFEDFAKYGASANAFTSFTRTSYLFSATDNISENTNSLLDFVQDPHFTEEGTEKEKGIIAQEIRMYEDNPGWQLFYGLLRNLYPEHPLSVDIAGTVESIQAISPELLQTCYDTFYHPSNMNLLMIGNFVPEEMMETIRQNQAGKTFLPAKPIQRTLPQASIQDIIRYKEIEMDVQRPKVMLGVKGLDADVTGNQAEKYKIYGSLLLELLFGRSSTHFIDLYDNGLIDDSFGYSFNLDRSFNFMAIESDTEEPKLLEDKLKRILLDWETDANLTNEKFDLLKKSMIGEQLQAFNSLEYIANHYSTLLFSGAELFEVVPLIEETSLEDIRSFAEGYLKEQNMSTYVILQKGAKQQ